MRTSPSEQNEPAPIKTPREEERQVTRGEFMQIFIAVMLPMFMAVVDQTMLATATPIVAADFGALHDTSWIATAYLLTNAVTVTVYGRLGDRYGRREMLFVSLGIYVAGSIVCGAAQSMNQLIAGRAVQGVGGGGLMTLSQALIGELVPARQRARFQAYFAVLFMAANVMGPLIGGIVVAHVNWRWVFALNLLFAAIAAWRLMLLPRGERHADSPGVSDIAGLALFALGTTALLFGVSSGGHRYAWLSWQTLACIGTGILAWAVLLVHARRHHAPFFPIDLLRIRALRLSVQTVLCSTFCMLAMIFYLPVYLQLGMRVGAASSGLLLTLVMLGVVLGGSAASLIVGRSGEMRALPAAGLTLSAAALLALALAPAYPALIVGLSFAAGLGLGPTMPIAQLMAQAVAGNKRLGAAVSLVSLARTLGAALGTALIGAVLYGLMPDVDLKTLVQTDSGGSDPQVLRAFRYAFFATALVAALGAFNASRVPRIRI